MTEAACKTWTTGDKEILLLDRRSKLTLKPTNYIFITHFWNWFELRDSK